MIQRYDEATHLPVIEGWIRARGIGEDQGVPLLPPTGFVADGIVVAFLYKTDAPLAYVGSIMSDPATTAAHRRAAIEAVLEAVRAEALRCGYAAIAGTPSRPTLIERFRDAGYHTVPDCAYAIRRT
jgi:hypothetical protein